MKNIKEAGLAAVHELLRRLPDAEASAATDAPAVGPHHKVDGVLHVRHRAGGCLLLVDVRPKGAPRFVREGVFHLESCAAWMRRSMERRDAPIVPMLVSPYLSPESRAICTDHDVAYLDFEGNARLAFDGVHLERSVASRPKAEKRALRSLFTPKAAAILRAMLLEPERAWRVTELAERANVSLGHVSGVRKALLDREWCGKEKGGIALTRPGTLMRAWREAHRRPKGRLVTGWTHLHGKPFDRTVLPLLNRSPDAPRAIESLATAAQWFASPVLRDGAQSFLTDETGAERLGEALSLSPAGTGANVVLHVTEDDTLFADASEPRPGRFCTNPVATYLDLWAGNDREREAADHLAKAAFPWLEGKAARPARPKPPIPTRNASP